MPTVELRREPLPHRINDRPLISSLRLRVEGFLGFLSFRRQGQAHEGTLAAALNKLGIEPFREDDVKRYKAKRARELDDQLWADFAATVLSADPAANPGTQPLSAIRERAARHSSLSVFMLGSDSQARWRKVPLRDYDGPVPEFAQSRALELATRLPEATLEVEELRADRRYDPFLIAVCGNERFYIDVWEEREFEEKV